MPHCEYSCHYDSSTSRCCGCSAGSPCAHAPQRTLILAGFIVTIAGIGVLLAMVIGISSPSAWAFAPGLLSRSVSNLGSCLGTAIAGTILVAGITATPERAYGLAMIALAAVGLIGLAASVFLPAVLTSPAATRAPQQNPPRPLETT